MMRCKNIRTIIVTTGVICMMASIAHAGSLTIYPDRLKSRDGHLEIALYDSESHYAKQETPTRRVYMALEELTNKGFTFKNLPEGFYAVAIYHDQNSNGQFDQNMFGWPLEGFGFSRDVIPILTLPDFQDTSFYLAGNSRAREAIVVRYWGQFDSDFW